MLPPRSYMLGCSVLIVRALLCLCLTCELNSDSGRQHVYWASAKRTALDRPPELSTDNTWCCRTYHARSRPGNTVHIIKRIYYVAQWTVIGSHHLQQLQYSIDILNSLISSQHQYTQGEGFSIVDAIAHNWSVIPFTLCCCLLLYAQIYHLACPASPPHYQFNPIKTIKTSTQGTLNMLGLAKRVGARMLLTSTSEVSYMYIWRICATVYYDVCNELAIL